MFVSSLGNAPFRAYGASAVCRGTSLRNLWTRSNETASTDSHAHKAVQDRNKSVKGKRREIKRILTDFCVPENVITEIMKTDDLGEMERLKTDAIREVLDRY